MNLIGGTLDVFPKMPLMQVRMNNLKLKILKNAKASVLMKMMKIGGMENSLILKPLKCVLVMTGISTNTLTGMIQKLYGNLKLLVV